MRQTLRKMGDSLVMTVPEEFVVQNCSGQLIPDTFLSFSSSSVGGSPPLKV